MPIAQQPRQHIYKPAFEPVAYAGDYVELVNPGAGASHIICRVLGVLALPQLEVDFASTGLTNGSSVGPAPFNNSSSVDQLIVGAYEFCQARLYLDERDWNFTKYPGSDAYLQLYAQGNANLLWATQNGQFAWRPYIANKFPDAAPTENFWYYNLTPQAKITNNSGATMSNVRVSVAGWHYWFVDRTRDYDAKQEVYREIAAEIALSPTGQLISLPLGPLGSTSLPGAVAR